MDEVVKVLRLLEKRIYNVIRAEEKNSKELKQFYNELEQVIDEAEEKEFISKNKALFLRKKYLGIVGMELELELEEEEDCRVDVIHVSPTERIFRKTTVSGKITERWCK